MINRTSQPEQPDSNKSVSGKPGAVQSFRRHIATSNKLISYAIHRSIVSVRKMKTLTACPTTRRSRVFQGLAVLGVLLLVLALEQILGRYIVNLVHQFGSNTTRPNKAYIAPIYMTVGSALVVTIVIVALRWLGAGSLRAAIQELGHFVKPWRGFVVGLCSAAPMYVGFALTMPLAKNWSLWGIFSLFALAWGSVAEEIVFRAFGVGTLWERCHAPLWLALLLPAMVFGAWHVGEGSGWSSNLALFGLTGTAGWIWGWMYLRWQRNVWVTASLHAAMDLTWALFNVSKNALGGWFPFALQLGTIVIAVLATIKLTSRIANPPYK